MAKKILDSTEVDNLPIQFDALDEESCIRAFDVAQKRFGSIDILINNVGGEGRWGDVIYEYFRSDSKSLEGEKPLKGIIDKPTGPKKGIQEYSHNLKGAYNIKWKRTDGLNQKIVYFFIDLQRE